MLVPLTDGVMNESQEFLHKYILLPQQPTLDFYFK